MKFGDVIFEWNNCDGKKRGLFNKMAHILYNEHQKDLIDFYYNVIRKYAPTINERQYWGDEPFELHKIIFMVSNESNDEYQTFKIYFGDMYSLGWSRAYYVAEPYTIDTSVCDSQAKDKLRQIRREWQDFLINIFGEEYKQALIEYTKTRLARNQERITEELQIIERRYKGEQESLKTRQKYLDEAYADFYEHFSEENKTV